MKPLHAIYKDGFFRKRHLLHWRAPIFCQAVIDIIKPESVIDIGCATGDLVSQFRQMGLVSDGLEGSDHALNHSVIEDILHWDLRCDLRNCTLSTTALLPIPYDLCLCLEVAEHIEPEYTKIFLGNLIYFSSNILLSIAGPGQKGLHHVNLQEMTYWDDLFDELGYTRKQSVADQIKKEISAWRSKPGIKAFWHNLVYYERR